MLRGDEVGALLAQHLLGAATRGVYATSIVSSSLLGKMAARRRSSCTPRRSPASSGSAASRTWPSATRRRSATASTPRHVRDKDGVSALMMVCDIAARAKAAGRTLRDLLDDIARTHGLHATDQLSVRMDDVAAIPAVVDRLRDAPADLAGRPRRRGRRRPVAGLGDGLPPTNGLRFRLADHGRVVVRPSGTEPKIKCYLEVVVPVEPGRRRDGGVDAARITAVGRLDAIRGDLQARGRDL